MKNKIKNIEIFENPQKLSERAADEFIRAATSAIEKQGQFFVALSGGKTPKGFMVLLGQREDSLRLPWDRIHIFWADERAVEPDSQQSNYRLAKDAFLSSVAIPNENIHRMEAELGDLPTAAQKYEQQLKSTLPREKGWMPRFDLVFLGMGSDGHTASLFPGQQPCRPNELVCPVENPDTIDRLTFCPVVLKAAERIVVLVAGGEKARTLAEVITTEPDGLKYPIHVLWPVLEKVYWFVDKSAGLYI